jgi:hypothetical protein
MINFKTLPFTIIFALSTSLLLPVAAQAKPNQTREPHYCGTKNTGRLIPDKPFGYNFKPACAAHDNCLTNGGSDKVCLAVFKDNLIEVCNSLPVGRNKKLSLISNDAKYGACLFTASTYASSVGLSVNIKKLTRVKIITLD